MVENKQQIQCKNYKTKQFFADSCRVKEIEKKCVVVKPVPTCM